VIAPSTFLTTPLAYGHVSELFEDVTSVTDLGANGGLLCGSSLLGYTDGLRALSRGSSCLLWTSFGACICSRALLCGSSRLGHSWKDSWPGVAYTRKVNSAPICYAPRGYSYLCLSRQTWGKNLPVADLVPSRAIAI
jgi:hypothetical protein